MADKTNNTDVWQILEVLRERDYENKGVNVLQWLEAKNIDKNSVSEVFDKLVEEKMDELFGKLMRSQNPEAIKVLIVALMGKAMEIGYTIGEVQLEEMFTD